MRFAVSVILTALLAFSACLFLPWWSIAATSFIVAAFMGQRALLSFFAAFTGVFLLWGVMALLISGNNGHLLAGKVGVLMFKQSSAFLLILITALVGGVVAAFAGLAGYYLRSLISPTTS